MKTQTIRNSILCLVVMLLVAPLLRAQDLSKYRSFSFGMSPADVLKQTDMKIADVKTLHSQPALIQELTWWLPMLPGNSYQADSVREILFTFCNGQLYSMSATYDRSAIEGLTTEDLVNSIAATYGPPIKPLTEIDAAKPGPSGPDEKVVAHWEDAQYSLTLSRSYLANGFTLVLYSVQAGAAAKVAIAAAIQLETQQGPQRAAELQKKQDDELAVARQKNLQSFRP
jgi:hypothetical protein